MSLWSVVEPISITFQRTLNPPITKRTVSSKGTKTHSILQAPRADVEALVKDRIERQKQSVKAVSLGLGLSQKTVLKICRTLKIGPHRTLTPKAIRSQSSQTPYGWSNDNGELKRLPAEWKWVRTIFKLHGKGLSLHKIAEHLETNKVSTKNGGRWFAKTISQIINFNSSHIKQS